MGRTLPEDTTVRLMRPMSSGNRLGTSLPMRSVSSPVNSTPVGPAPITCVLGGGGEGGGKPVNESDVYIWNVSSANARKTRSLLSRAVLWSEEIHIFLKSTKNKAYSEYQSLLACRMQNPRQNVHPQDYNVKNSYQIYRTVSL